MSIFKKNMSANNELDITNKTLTDISQDALIKNTFKHKTNTSASQSCEQKSRRGFLKNLALGSATLVATKSMANNFVFNEQQAIPLNFKNPLLTPDETKLLQIQESTQTINKPPEETPITYQVCNPNVIETRFFSSSNASTSSERNELAIKRLTCAGFDIKNPEVLSRQHYRFGGTDSERINDFQQLVDNPNLAPKLLLGVRGGYGAMRLLTKVNWHKLGSVLSERGTILGGFSDVTAIQCALLAKGHMGSFNIPMAYSEFGKYQPDPISCFGFVKSITRPDFKLTTTKSDRTHPALPLILSRHPHKVIQGTLWGGNLSVLSSLSGSEFLPKPKGGIVFIEEVGEQPYRIERMLYDMYLTGAFKNQQAIVFGAMARCSTDGYDPTYNVAAVLRHLHYLTGLPIYSGVGFGHVSKKQSFPMGFKCQILPTSYGYDLRFYGHPVIEASLIHESALSMVL